MVLMPQRRWLTLAASVILVALAIGSASAFLHGHEAGSGEDHCAVCHAYYTSTTETPQTGAELQASARTLSPEQFDTKRDVLDGVYFSRGPPRFLSL